MRRIDVLFMNNIETLVPLHRIWNMDIMDGDYISIMENIETFVPLNVRIWFDSDKWMLSSRGIIQENI